MISRTHAIAFACTMICGCWPAPPADEREDEASSTGAVVSLCFDGVRDGDETDIDCGGSVCAGCFGDARCEVNHDCVSGYCAAGSCAYLRSCHELQTLADGQDGVFWVDFDEDGPDPPARVLCDQSTDGGGWTLGFKVHRAARDDVAERRETLRDGFNPHLLLDVATTVDRGVASHGTIAMSDAISADPWARITLVAGADEEQRATWFKRIASARSLSRWFYDDDELSDVCPDAEGQGPCEQGVIAVADDLTLLGGMDLSKRGYRTDGPLHLRLRGTEVDPVDSYNDASGVCSVTKDYDDNAWNDTQGAEHQWGNGLLIWIR